MTLKLVEDFGVQQARNDIRDALQSVGEQCIVLAMRHELTDADAERCPLCDDDIYNEGEGDCPQCYGTRFAQPIKQAAKVWAVFADEVADEKYGKQGVWEPDVREFQTEAFPLIKQHDYVVRARRWTPDGRIAEIEGFYGIQQVIQNSLRTGNRFGQYVWDVVGQKATVSKLPGSVGITKYPVLNRFFTVAQAEPHGALANPPVAPPIVSPNPSGLQWRQVLYYTQSTPAVTWTITHPFDLDPVVTLFIDNAEADTDVEYPNDHTVVLTFATPQTGRAQLIFVPHPNEPLPPLPSGVAWRQVLSHTQNAPANTWTISHVFDDLPSATLFLGSEEADTDVSYPDDQTVVLSFAEPQSGRVELV